VFVAGVAAMATITGIALGGVLKTGDTEPDSPGQLLALNVPAVANS